MRESKEFPKKVELELEELVDEPALSNFTAAELIKCSTVEARKLLSYKDASRLGVLPLSVTGGPTGKSLLCAAKNTSPQLILEVRFAAGTEIKLQKVAAEIMESAIFAAYNGSEDRLKNKLAEIVRKNPKQAIEALPQIPVRSSDSDAAHFVTLLLDYAIAHQASDLHISPRRDGSMIRLRINGELRTQHDPLCPKLLHEQMVVRIKVLAKLDPAVKTRPQDGAFVMPCGERNISLRISTMPALHGESVAVRFLGNAVLPNFKDLSLPSRAKEFLEKAMSESSGLILFVGPTGSGKSTSMYAALTELERRGLNIVTVEDPVELELPKVVQVNVNEKQGLSYATALRSVLRHDPDVILIGEIRDRESAAIATEAALTGHLLFATVHARSSFDVFSRLESLGIPRVRAAEVVRLVVFQRLIPKLCTKCRVIDLQESQLLGCTVYRITGCASCDYSGYDGRVVAAEVLSMDRSAKEGVSNSLGLVPMLEHLGIKNSLLFQESLEELLKEGSVSASQFLDLLSQGTLA